jgi:hypothetical protein
VIHPNTKNKTPAAIHRSAKRLAQKAVDRTLRRERKEAAAKLMPYSGLQNDPPMSWSKLLATAVSRPLIGYPFQRPIPLIVLPLFLLLPGKAKGQSDNA